MMPTVRQNFAPEAPDRTPAACGAEKPAGGIGEARREADFSKVPMFTAREIADALGGITKQAVLARLAGISADGTKTVRGQRDVRAWRAESFPPSLSADMEALCFTPDGTRAFRTVVDLFTKRPATRTPAAADFPADAQALAERKMEILAPLLSKKAATGMALAALSRIASGQFADFPGGKPSHRTIEEWTRIAERRDRGRHQFDRPELFLPESAPSASSANEPAADAFLFPTLETYLAECERPLPAGQRPLLWHAAFVDFEAACAHGYGAASARRVAVDRLAHFSSPLYPATSSVILKAWGRKFPVWQELGRRPEALADARKANAGRPVKFTLTRDEALCLRGHRLERRTLPLAVQWFVKDSRCLPATREVILATMDDAARKRRNPNWPDSIRKAGHVTKEEEATFRGRKAMQNLENCDRRGMIWVDESNTRRPLMPGALWESDDMSSNEPFSYTDADSGETLLGRQMLFTQDVFSAAWLGFTPIGRVRDAYRVEDIADHMAALVEAHGLPMAWRLERGVWENTFIDGIDVSQLTGREDDVWGGLDPLFKILRTWKSRGKGSIETSFNHLQNLTAHESASIGRSRGEFEQATREYLRAQDGNTESAAKFWDIAACADGYVKACALFNEDGKTRRAHGKNVVVPNDLFRAAVRRDCAASELWRFLPVKRLATVRQGALEMSVKHYPMNFRFRVNGAPGSDLYIEHGYKVLVAFHPGKPELGCQVFNAETGTRNRDGHRFGAHLLTAPMAEDAPQFSLSRSEQDAFAMRRKAAAAVRTEFRAIMPAGRAAARISTARDGRGNSAEVSRNTTPRRAVVATAAKRAEQSKGDALIAGARAAHKRSEFDYDAEAERLRIEEQNASELPT